MPVDEIAEGLFRVVGRIIAHLIVDVLIEVIFYLIGKVALRIITLGKYPPPPEERHSVGFVQLFGFLVVVAAFVVLFMAKQ